VLYIGLMSGTSADGIDGVLVDLQDRSLTIIATCDIEYSAGVGESIETAIIAYPDIDGRELGQLDEALARDFARAVAQLVSAAPPGASIAALGSHGQTIYHGPRDTPPISVQLGSPWRIAALSGLTTIGNFRANDLRAGGQGAPLAPAFHNAMFRDKDVDRIIVNIGGIANLTYLPADPGRPVLGYDSGPGNTLMDQWCRMHTGQAYDTDGRWARTGRAEPALVDALLADPYFDLAAPKSTGREYFNLDWLRKRYPGWQTLAPENVQASLLEVTALSIAQAGREIGAGGCREIYVCGGGAANTVLMERLATASQGRVASTGSLGVPPAWVEACAFAWLAQRRLAGLAGNIPSVTGAVGPVVLGEICTP